MNIRKLKIKNLQQGYTIIETMIAVSVFLVVITMGMSSLLNANLVHQKSEDMRSILDSLSFVMEDMSRNLRTGYGYQCFTSQALNSGTLGGPRSCADGYAVAFEAEGGNAGTYTDQWVYEFSNGKIYRSTNGMTSTLELTPPEVVMDNASGVSVLGAESFASGNTQQPLIIIRLVGTITIPGKNVVTPFSIETAVSQRNIDI